MTTSNQRDKTDGGILRGVAAKRRRLAAFALLAVWGAGTAAHAAEDGPVRFHDVEGWRGTLVASAKADPSVLPLIERTLLAAGGTGSRWNFHYGAVATVDFLLDEYESDPSVWRGRVTGSTYETDYRLFVHLTEARPTNPTWKGYTDNEWIFNANGPLNFADDPKVELQFHRDRGWSVRMASGRVATEVRSHFFRYAPRVYEQDPKHDLIIADDVSLREKADTTARGMGSTGTLPYPKQGMVLFASGQKKSGSFPLTGSVGATPAVIWDYAIYLEPTSMTELRLEIEESDAYREWRPSAKTDGGPGDPLEIKATVVSVNGSKINTTVESFIWELKETSTEPGVALNYPVAADDFAYDLELEATGPMSVVESASQRVTRAVREGFSDTVKVVPRDWGGWATLHVTAVLSDGRRVTGKLKGKSEAGVRLPKRPATSKIADSWKEKNKSGADDLDDENEPEGDGHKGDGFSLYEEYRGFIINGEHLTGDPKAKDFFVLNLIGGDAENGIGLFESLSGFRVHTTDSKSEISETDRVMNGNRSEGAQVVRQHAVVLQNFSTVEELGGSGAYTVSLDGSQGGKISFRPATTKGIGLLPRGHAESDFSKPFNLAAQDLAGVYDRGIAHELLHSVGAIHHGPQDAEIEFVFVPPKSPVNRAGRPYFTVGGGEGPPTDLRDEAKHDLAAAVYPRYAAALEQYMNTFRAALVGSPGDPGFPKTSESDYELWASANVKSAFDLKGLVGIEGGAHAGHQDCIMRYYFADFYPMKNSADGFYQVAAGTEKIGSILCRAPDGTGINAPGRLPQSRYGNATAGAGNCAAQISPNDLVPPRPVPFK